MTRSLIRTLACSMFILAPISAAAALSGSDSYAGQPDYVPGEVLVVPSAVPSAQALNGMGMQIAVEHRGRARFMRLKVGAGQSVDEAVAVLANEPWVAKAQPNYIYRAAAPVLLPNDPDFSKYWGLHNTGQLVNGVTGSADADIDAPEAWDRVTNCASVVVAVIDSGVDYNHPDLAANIWVNTGDNITNGIDDDGNGYIDDSRGWDFIQMDNDPMDFHSHGSHVAGTVGAVGNNAIGGTGVCWSVQLMPVRALGTLGRGTTAELTAAIDYAVANGANVINMSLGGTGGFTGDIIDTAIASARAAGILVVAAAGNTGTNNDASPFYPASYNRDNIISVAATDQDDSLAWFSNFGITSVDVAASGVNIYSTVPPDRTVISSEDFEAGAPGWTYETRNNITDLIIANTVAVTTEDSFSPTHSLTDRPGGNYFDNRSYRAWSSPYDFTGFDGLLLRFMLKLDSEFPVDELFVEGSLNGATWTALPLDDPGLTGSFPAWTQIEADMQGADGALAASLRFRMETDGSVVGDGFHIDDVEVTRPGTAYVGTEYRYFQGTSMVSPHVAGLAALIWAAEPGLTYAQVRSRILGNGDLLASLAGLTATGRRINAQMSMALDAPTGLLLAALPSNARFAQVSLTWTDNAISEDAYLVQRSSGAGFATIATVAADTVAYVDSAAPAGTTVSYRVVAQARDGRTLSSGIQIIATSAALGGSSPVPPGGCLIPAGERLPWLTLVFLLLLAGIGQAGRRRQ